jgi:hypothetical protein
VLFNIGVFGIVSEPIPFIFSAALYKMFFKIKFVTFQHNFLISNIVIGLKRNYVGYQDTSEEQHVTVEVQTAS